MYKRQVLAGVADKMAVLPIQLRLSTSDNQMLSEWSGQLDAAARLYRLVD